MRTIVFPVLSTLLGLLRNRTLLHLEILALRQQLAMVKQTPRKQPRFRGRERLFWVYRLWPGCLQTLLIFKPDTLVRWHRNGFRLYWTWKSRCRRGGRPPIAPEVRKLIQTMSQDSVDWGAPRIHVELQTLVEKAETSGLTQLFSLKHDFPTEWHKFTNNGGDFIATIKKEYFPYFVQD